MKTVILSIFLFAISLFGISQNKKEQIEALNYRVDSCKTINNINVQSITSTQKTIDSCNVALFKQKQELTKNKNKVLELDLDLIKESQVLQERNNEIISLKKEIELIKEKIPLTVFFKCKKTKLAKADDYGNLFSTDICLVIDGQQVATYTEAGEISYDLELNKNELYIFQESFDIDYIITSVESSQITISHIVWGYLDGRNRMRDMASDKELFYTKNSAGQWKFSHCTGDCDE